VRFYKTNFDIEGKTHWRLKIAKKNAFKNVAPFYQ